MLRDARHCLFVENLKPPPDATPVVLHAMHILPPSPTPPLGCIPPYLVVFYHVPGSNAMETFDNKAAVRKQDMQAKLKTSTMVKDSKSRQRNAWGSTGTVSKSLYTVRGSTKEWRSKSPTSEARAVQALWEEALQKNVQLLFIPPSQTLGTFRLTPYQVCHRGPAVAVWNQTVSTVVTLTVQGYADKLKDEGMVNVNLKGEDTKTIRRQQFEVSS